MSSQLYKHSKDVWFFLQYTAEILLHFVHFAALKGKWITTEAGAQQNDQYGYNVQNG